MENCKSEKELWPSVRKATVDESVIYPGTGYPISTFNAKERYDTFNKSMEETAKQLTEGLNDFGFDVSIFWHNPLCANNFMGENGSFLIIDNKLTEKLRLEDAKS